jgi:DNA-binding SARP family transcriptional activator
VSFLSIRLLGNARITQQHDAVPLSRVTRSMMGLLAYLLIHRQRFLPREVLSGVFWGNQSEARARSCLNTALWRLRQVLEPRGIGRGTYLLTTPMGEVSFNWASDYWLDISIFEESAGRFLTRPAPSLTAAEVRNFETSLGLWTGELLEGFYEDWALRERERLRILYLKSLAHLMDYYGHHLNYDEGLACGARILEFDPLREEIHRAMMRLYLESGQRTLAIQQYRTCCQILQAELGIPPLEETQALYARVMQDSPAPQPRSTPGTRSEAPEAGAALTKAAQELQMAIQNFQASAAKLQEAIRTMEELANPAPSPASPPGLGSPPAGGKS